MATPEGQQNKVQQDLAEITRIAVSAVDEGHTKPIFDAAELASKYIEDHPEVLPDEYKK